MAHVVTKDHALVALIEDPERLRFNKRAGEKLGVSQLGYRLRFATHLSIYSHNCDSCDGQLESRDGFGLSLKNLLVVLLAVKRRRPRRIVLTEPPVLTPRAFLVLLRRRGLMAGLHDCFLVARKRDADSRVGGFALDLLSMSWWSSVPARTPGTIIGGRQGGARPRSPHTHQRPSVGWASGEGFREGHGLSGRSAFRLSWLLGRRSAPAGS